MNTISTMTNGFSILLTIFALSSGMLRFQAQAPALASELDTRNSELGELITIPAGPFLMGNNGYEGNEGPE